MSMDLIKQGAEAKIYTCTYLGRPAILKKRFEKRYRDRQLDEALIKERIKNEARGIARCKSVGIKAPALYCVDFTSASIYMEHFEKAITVKDFIINLMKVESVDKEEILSIVAKKIGVTIRKMHDINVVHGDLTTSNMLLSGNKLEEDGLKIDDETELIMIDFGLSHAESNAEDKGVDLYVLERALISTHNDVPSLFNIILDAYKQYDKNNVQDIIAKYEDVRMRGRKRTMVG